MIIIIIPQITSASPANRASTQPLVEIVREISLREGALPGLYSGLVVQARTSLVCLLEASQNVSVMFSTRAGLEEWAWDRAMKEGRVGEVPADEAVCLTPTRDPGKSLDPSVMYWVRATSERYREALVDWYRNCFPTTEDVVGRAHRESLTFLKVARQEIAVGSINWKTKPKDYASAASQLINKAIGEHEHALAANEPDEKLAFQLLGTVDADHVLNRASLPDLPDAWVLLFPVPADANRAMGSKVERYLPRVVVGTERVDIDAQQFLKAFSNFFPRNADEFALADRIVANQLLELSVFSDLPWTSR